MKLFGIFDKNKNYKLIRYSNINQSNNRYNIFDTEINKVREVEEICISDIDYDLNNIGKNYDIKSKKFLT